MMQKIVWMTDLHYVRNGEVAGVDVRKRLTDAVDYVNAWYSDAAFCVISGDMVQEETPATYRALQAQLKDLRLTYLPMVGNKDDREMMKAALDVPDDCLGGFVQYSVQIDQGVILCLDTQKVGSAAGELCQARMSWIKTALEAAGERPVYIFMHHPPMALDLPAQDEICLEQGAAFLDMIAAYPNVRHLFIGHVHRAVSGVVRGIPYATMKAVSFHAPAPRPDWSWDGFTHADEPANLGVITLRQSGVNLHFLQF